MKKLANRRSVKRNIWGGNEFRDCGDFIIQKIHTKAKTNNKYIAIDEEHRRHSKEMNMNKQFTLDITGKRENENVQITTTEIREGRKHGHARIAWRK